MPTKREEKVKREETMTAQSPMEQLTDALGTLAGQTQETLAGRMKQLMAERGWSLRGAQNATGLPFNSVDRMLKGVMVETDTIVRFARAIAPEGKEMETVIEWLRLGGRSYVAEMIERAMLKPAAGNEFSDLQNAFLGSDVDHRRVALQILSLGKSSSKKTLKN